MFQVNPLLGVHCDAGGVSLLTIEKQRKTDIRLTD